MKITDNLLARFVAAIPAAGATLRQIAELASMHVSNARSVYRLLEGKGTIITMRAGTGEGSKHEVWCFTTPEAHEAFEDKWLDEKARRTKAQQDAKRERLRARREAEQPQEPSKARSEAAERREARKRAERAEQEAKRQAEAEALKKAQQKLKRQTAAAGATVFKAGTVTPKPKKTAWADMPAKNLDEIVPQRIECKVTTPYAVKPEEVPPLFSSLRPGQYIAPAPAWVEAIAA